MLYYKAKIQEVQIRNSEKSGEYIAIKFIYDDEDQQGNIIEKIAYKNFFINHPNQELAKKASQVLYRMKSYFGKNPAQIDNNVFANKEVFITINPSDRYLNVNQVYFLKEVVR